MDLKTRAQNIITTPNTEWPVIAAEQSSTGSLITGYVMPLAAIGAIAGFIGGSLVGTTIPFVGTYRAPFMVGLTSACFVFAMAIIGVVILAFIINALAPTFGGQQNSSQAMKVAVYSYTPAWIAGVLQIFPPLSVLGVLAGLYGIYLLYLGLPHLMKAPQDKAVGYTAVVVVCAIVLTIVLGIVGGLVMAPAAMAGLAGAGAGGGGGILGEPPFLEMHGLEEGPVLAGGLEAERGEALRDQVRGAAMAVAARLATLHVVGGQSRHSRPPGAGAFGLRGGRRGDGGGGGESGGEQKQGQAHGSS